MPDNPTLDVVSVVNWRRLGLTLAALSAGIAATVALVGYSQQGAWLLVKDAHTVSLDGAIAQAKDELNHSPPRPGAAKQADVDKLTKILEQNQVLMVEQRAASKSAALLAGASVCKQAGGSPHQATETCIFVVGGTAELVPLADASALLARIKLSSKARRALESR